MKEKVRIKCPGCGVVLEVSNPEGAPSKLVACPKCGKKIQLDFKSASAEDPGTVIGGGYPGTVIGDRPSDGTFGGCLMCGGRRYPLSEGRQVVGRRGKERQADVMLDVKDMSMSRLHAIIEVKRIDSGWKVTLANHQGQLMPVVDGVTLQPGDIARLNDGSRIRLGNTDLDFRL